MAPSTRSNNNQYQYNDNATNTDPFMAQQAAVASRLESIESLKDDVAALKAHKTNSGPGRFDDGESSWRPNQKYRPYNKINFPTVSNGDPRGWILKAEKYFRHYQTPDDEKVDVAAMHLEGDALDLYSWLSAEQPVTFWEDLVQVLQKNFGPAEFQNSDEYLCSIKKTGTIQGYRQEFAKRAAQVSNWLDNCLLGVLLNGLKEELKADVRIHKPRTVYNAMSLALEFETKLDHTRYTRGTSLPYNTQNPNPITSTITPKNPHVRISDAEKQTRFLKGECFRCGDKYGPGHQCKAGTFKLLAAEGTDEPVLVEDEETTTNLDDMAEVSLHAIFGKSNTTL